MNKNLIEIKFQNIDYALIDLDLERNSEYESLEEMNSLLLKNISIQLCKDEFKDLLKQINESSEQEAIFNLFVKKRKWLLKSADVSIKKIKFRKNIIFAEQYINARTMNALYNNEKNLDKILADVSAIFDDNYSIFLI